MNHLPRRRTLPLLIGGATPELRCDRAGEPCTAATVHSVDRLLAQAQFPAGQPNGLRYLRVGGCGQNSESRILLGRRKCSKMPQNPTRQVHAVFGGFILYNKIIT